MSIPPEIGNLTELNNLSLRNNRLCNLDPDMVAILDSLNAKGLEDQNCVDASNGEGSGGGGDGCFINTLRY